jgi:hypothetical protein
MDDKRIERFEIITKRLMRRAVKRTAALITPYPISNAVFGEKVEGPILRYMFPCDGTVTKGFVRLGKRPKTSVGLGVKMFNETGSTSKGFVLEKKFLSIQPNLPVTAGDCLEISILPGVDEPVTEVWISFLWRPTVKDVEIKSYLIEELENDSYEKALTEGPSLPGGEESPFNG